MPPYPPGEEEGGFATICLVPHLSFQLQQKYHDDELLVLISSEISYNLLFPIPD